MLRFRTHLNMLLNANQKRRTVLLMFDLLCFVAVDIFFYFIALRASGSVPVEEESIFLINSVMHLVGVFVARYCFAVYKNVWRYSNTKAYYQLVMAFGRLRRWVHSMRC